MIVILPTVERKFKEGTNEMITTRGELPVTIDLSIAAHLKWDQQFKQECGGTDLTSYLERLQREMRKGDLGARGEILSALKVIYCFVDSTKLPTFLDFLRLFDPSVAGEIIEKLRVILEEYGKTISKN